ncbi:hypothetical protein [Bizionia sp. M204]|uniref:hypothetical protein n=1 Tax=Bizionia sp. M204 TaxID=2675331 RepID=UPI00206FFE08|nr:hypothetical protein [Bizionia sp. M204]UPS92822.1 hypothetical protein GMA17_14305 [Bizionia sp. M204]
METIYFDSLKSEIEKERCNIHSEYSKFEKTNKASNASAFHEEFRSTLRKKDMVHFC